MSCGTYQYYNCSRSSSAHTSPARDGSPNKRAYQEQTLLRGQKGVIFRYCCRICLTSEGIILFRLFIASEGPVPVCRGEQCARGVRRVREVVARTGMSMTCSSMFPNP